MKSSRRNAIAGGCMLMVAYVSVFGVTPHDGGQHVAGLSPVEAKEEKEWKIAKTGREERTQEEAEERGNGKVQQLGNVPYLDPPFGYNKKRNVERWKMIYTSMLADASVISDDFSLVDYGADEGYFSISAAHAFPKGKVIAVDMGGVGGSIWKKGGHDVLKVQEQKIKMYSVKERVAICQTEVKPKHFFDLAKQGTGHDYQFVLSVFHWFTMGSRDEFEAVLVRLFKNAKTTFIELPIAGDFGPRFMKQVGSKYFVKWYDGRSNIQQIIEEALAAHKVSSKVSKIGAVKWLPGDKSKGEKDWDRELYRVELTDGAEGFNCKKHFDVYGCAAETHPNPVEFSKCRYDW